MPRRPRVAFIDSLLLDIRYAFRTSRRMPTVTATVIATIALGLGLSAAVFTIFNAVVFRPDAVRDPDSLYSFTWSSRGQTRHRFTLREYEAVRRENDVFADVAARNFDLTTRIEGQGAEGQLVSGNYLSGAWRQRDARPHAHARRRRCHRPRGGRRVERWCRMSTTTTTTTTTTRCYREAEQTSKRLLAASASSRRGWMVWLPGLRSLNATAALKARRNDQI